MAVSIFDLANNLGKNTDDLSFKPTSPLQISLGKWVNERIKVAREKLDEPKGTNPSRDSNATGSLRNSISPEIEAIGNKVVVDVMANDYWDRLNSGVNGVYRNFGAKYSFETLLTPTRFIQDIERWIRDRDIVPREPEMSRQQLALVIARSVKKKGVEPVPFMDEAFSDEAIKELADRLGKEIKINFTV